MRSARVVAGTHPDQRQRRSHRTFSREAVHLNHRISACSSSSVFTGFSLNLYGELFVPLMSLVSSVAPSRYDVREEWAFMAPARTMPSVGDSANRRTRLVLRIFNRSRVNGKEK